MNIGKLLDYMRAPVRSRQLPDQFIWRRAFSFLPAKIIRVRARVSSSTTASVKRQTSFIRSRQFLVLSNCQNQHIHTISFLLISRVLWQPQTFQNFTTDVAQSMQHRPLLHSNQAHYCRDITGAGAKPKYFSTMFASFHTF